MSLPLNHHDEGVHNAGCKGIRLLGGTQEIDGVQVSELGGPGTCILALNGLFTREDCDQIVAYFRTHADKVRQGKTVGGETSTKQCTEIPLQLDSDEARHIDELVFKKMQRAIPIVDQIVPAFLDGQCRDSNYMIQRYENKDQFYHWHVDVGAKRRLAIILYLNDVAEGGETEFWYQDVRVKPEAGKLLVFPASAGHTHRGRRPLSGEKFILTSFLLGETKYQ